MDIDDVIRMLQDVKKVYSNGQVAIWSPTGPLEISGVQSFTNPTDGTTIHCLWPEHVAPIN